MTTGQFVYHENIQLRYASTLPSSMQIHATSREELVIMRLLLGTLKIENTITGQIIKQKTNYSLNDFKSNTAITNKQITDFLDVDLKISDVDTYLKNAVKHGNKKLFKHFLLELTHYFFCSENKNHLSAFLHIYRALELISYCFPLYYASKSKDYHGTYDTLKKFFTESSGNERSFFKSFVHNHLFLRDPILDIRLPVVFDNSNVILQEQYFNTFFKVQKQNVREIEVLDYNSFSEVVIKRRGLISLIIAIRNRNFHLLEGDYNDNITTDELYDFNGFYKNFNEIFLNWVSLIFLKILKAAIEAEK